MVFRFTSALFTIAFLCVCTVQLTLKDTVAQLYTQNNLQVNEMGWDGMASKVDRIDVSSSVLGSIVRTDQEKCCRTFYL